jgi:hypothetical protein
VSRYSGCVAAVFRVVVTLEFAKTNDETYYASIVALWPLGEMTSMFLVACVPAIPSLFMGRSNITQAASRLASWMGLSTRKNSISTPNITGLWDQGNGANHGRFQKIHGTEDGPLPRVAPTSETISITPEGTKRLQSRPA